MVFCHKCGRKNDDDSNFCIKCGTKLRKKNNGDKIANKTIEGIGFNIPPNFNLYSSEQGYVEGVPNSRASSNMFVNNVVVKAIIIGVGEYNNGNPMTDSEIISFLNFIGQNIIKKTINGNNGYGFTEYVDGTPLTTFVYIKNGKMVTIATDDAQLLEDVIV